MNQTREITFRMDDPNYRVVCQFNYDNLIPYVWWGYLQKKVTYKKWIFFGEEKFRWTEIGKCWWSYEIETREELFAAAKNLYKDKVLIPKRIIDNAMNL